MLDSNNKIISKECRIENTNLCNARCIICPREKMTRPETFLPFTHFKNLVDQAKDLGATTISIFGYGEPLLDKFIDKEIEYCTDLDLETFLTTNASMLDNDMALKILKAGLTHIRFSVHGLWPRTYENVHRGLTALRVFRNVLNFIYVNKYTFNNSCKVSLSFIPLHDEKIEDIRGYWEPLVDWLEIWRPHNWTDGRNYRKVIKKRKTCGRPFSGPVQIQADGKVIPCCFITNGDIILGDTYTDSIEDILKGDKFNEIRRKHREGDLAGLICETCDQLNIEEENPLLYSNRDVSRQIGKTSSTKFKLEDKKNGFDDN